MKRPAILLAVMLAACASGQGSKKDANSLDGTTGVMRPIGDTPRCDGSKGKESQADLNHDERYDVRKITVRSGEADVTICREADINFDGVIELVEFFNEKGEKIRDEVDLDYDGQIDIITWYSGVKVFKQELDTNTDGKVDRVRYLEGGVPVRLEGDTDQDGRVDYWEYYEDGQLIRVGMDSDGDGRADKWIRDEKAIASASAASNEDTDSDSDSAAGAEAEKNAPEAPADAESTGPKQNSKEISNNPYE